MRRLKKKKQSLWIFKNYFTWNANHSNNLSLIQDKAYVLLFACDTCHYLSDGWCTSYRRSEPNICQMTRALKLSNMDMFSSSYAHTSDLCQNRVDDQTMRIRLNRNDLVLKNSACIFKIVVTNWYKQLWS